MPSIIERKLRMLILPAVLAGLAIVSHEEALA